MNVSGAGLSNAYPVLTSGKVSISGSKIPEKEEKNKEKNKEDIWIEQFKEENNPVSKKVDQIMGKFMAGNDLSSAELDFLAKNAPDCYQTVQEVLAERQQLEMKLEAAETKLEVLQVYTEALTMVKETKGTGEVEKQNALKTLMRVNQLGDSFGEFVASPEYAELPDEGDVAEEISEAVEENTDQSALQPEAEPAEADTAEAAETEPVKEDTAEASETEPVKEDTAEVADTEGKEGEIAKSETSETEEEKKHLRRSIPDFTRTDIEFRRKVHSLYKNNMNRSEELN